MKIKRWHAITILGIVVLLLATATLAFARQIEPQAGTGPSQDDPETESTITVSGTLSTKTVNEEAYYVLQDASGKVLYYLEAGPKWFYANNSKAYPFDAFLNQQVTLTGSVDQPKAALPDNASPRAKANKAKVEAEPTDAPSLEVYTINGQTVRASGKPPWAGGPKKVPGHPGNGKPGKK